MTNKTQLKTHAITVRLDLKYYEYIKNLALTAGKQRAKAMSVSEFARLALEEVFAMPKQTELRLTKPIKKRLRRLLADDLFDQTL